MAAPERCTTSKPHPLINRSEFTLDGPIPIHVSIDHLDHDALRALGIDLDAR